MNRVNIPLRIGVCLLMACTMINCGGNDEPPDPVTEIKKMIPKLQEALNSRAIGDLKDLGTRDFEANRIIIDVFGTDTEAQARLSVDRLQFVGKDVHASLHLDLTGGEEVDRRLLILTLVGNGDWEIDGFEIQTPSMVDSLSDTL